MSRPTVIRKPPPLFIIRALSSFRKFLLYLHRITYPASVVMYERFTNFWLLSAVRVAVEHNISGILKDGPLTIEELATRTSTDTEALRRLMRALVSEKIFKRTTKGLYVNTRLSETLTDGNGSIKYTLLQHLGTLNWTVFGDLSYSIKTGKPAFSKYFGMHIYDYLKTHPDQSELFDLSMTNLSEISIEPILGAVDFKKYPLIADIGGGEGLLLSSILYKCPGSKGILFDLPEGLNRADSILNKSGVSERVQIVKGDFFKEAPDGADAYLLKNILHNWGTEDCITILTNIRHSMPPHSRIFIIEVILDETNNHSMGKLIDLQMMVFMENGKERTLGEFSPILANSGLKINRIIPTIAPLSIIEAVAEV